MLDFARELRVVLGIRFVEVELSSDRLQDPLSTSNLLDQAAFLQHPIAKVGLSDTPVYVFWVPVSGALAVGPHPQTLQLQNL